MLIKILILVNISLEMALYNFRKTIDNCYYDYNCIGKFFRKKIDFDDYVEFVSCIESYRYYFYEKDKDFQFNQCFYRLQYYL